jgi:hypothetical protein
VVVVVMKVEVGEVETCWKKRRVVEKLLRQDVWWDLISLTSTGSSTYTRTEVTGSGTATAKFMDRCGQYRYLSDCAEDVPQPGTTPFDSSNASSKGEAEEGVWKTEDPVVVASQLHSGDGR